MPNKFKYLFIPSAILFALFVLSAGNAQAQSDTFSDPNIEFTFAIPDDRWRVVGRDPYVNLIFTTPREGELEIRKTNVPASKPLADIIREEEQKLQFLPGYVAGKEENFSGNLRGAIFNFEFIRSGRNMAGRFYFLRSGDVVYILRFTGYTTSLRSIRNQTDAIARTFQIKK